MGKHAITYLPLCHCCCCSLLLAASFQDCLQLGVIIIEIIAVASDLVRFSSGFRREVGVRFTKEVCVTIKSKVDDITIFLIIMGDTVRSNCEDFILKWCVVDWINWEGLFLLIGLVLDSLHLLSPSMVIVEGSIEATRCSVTSHLRILWLLFRLGILHNLRLRRFSF
jgi:hypothetical protein